MARNAMLMARNGVERISNKTKLHVNFENGKFLEEF